MAVYFSKMAATMIGSSSAEVHLVVGSLNPTSRH